DDGNFTLLNSPSIVSLDSYDPWLSESLLYDSIPCMSSPASTDNAPPITHEESARDDIPSTVAPSRFSGITYARRTPSIDDGSTLRRSTRLRHPIHRWVSYDNFSLDFQLFLTKVSKTIEPSTFHEVVHSRVWIEAMNEEMEALHGPQVSHMGNCTTASQ
ncbi:hypothetical protein QML37_30060, partial [Klebsiella pneumoniae]|uniref:hypothetical protein n=1 Tax=Klebsiella pneumoniae TaxID=573 RepID=UPI003A7F7DB2